ncbi:DUF664 domain-containing protein [bacterium]|nr:DUF664 domain-containing protein [bacterium]
MFTRGIRSNRGYALACLETERERTRVAVTGLSIEALDAEVDGSPNSIGSLLYHIAGIELDWLYAEILERDIPESYAALFPVEVRDREGHLSAVMGVSASEHLQRLETVRADVLTQLKPMTTEEFYRVRCGTRLRLSVEVFGGLWDALSTDRVIVYRFHNDWNGTIIAESVSAGWQKRLSSPFSFLHPSGRGSVARDSIAISISS